MATTMDNNNEEYTLLTNLIVNNLSSERSQSFMNENLTCITKCSKTSNDLRKEGNTLYAKKMYDNQKIFELYTKSIAYAPNNSENLALAFGNRSAILQKMNKYKESIDDINRALAWSSSPWHFKIKLLCRKVECLAALGSPDCKKVFDEAVSIKLENINESANCKKTLDLLKSAEMVINKFSIKETRNNGNKNECMSILPSKTINNHSASVSIEYNENCIVAARDIKPGEIICVDKLYVSCLDLRNSHAYCGHCFTKSWVNLPCDYCNWCMFCSEECKKLAWTKYHDFECATVSYLIKNHNIDYYDHLSLRSLLKGIKESGSISKFKAYLQSTDKCIEQNDEILQNNGFKHIFSSPQWTNISKWIQKCVINTAIVLIILCKYTIFFGPNQKFKETQDLLTNEDVLFIGSVLLKLRKNSTISTHLTKKEDTNSKISNDSTPYKLACLTPINFYIKHSCFPNTVKCITNDQKVIMFAVQPIQKNSPVHMTSLFISYHETFYNLEKLTRERRIQKNMSFACKCLACKESWPTLNELYKMPKEKPLLYAKSYNKMESELFDENNALVKPIINGHNKVQYNKATLIQLAKAMEKALKYLKQPSVVICELMICLEIVFEKLYSSENSL